MLVFASNISYSQVTFQKTIAHPQFNVTEYLYDAVLDPFQNIYTVGSNNSISNMEFMKTDSLGHPYWLKSLSSKNIIPKRIIFTSDSCLLIGGICYDTTSNQSYLSVIKCDTAGSIIWSNYQTALFESIIDVEALVELADSCYYITGNYFEYDSTGNAFLISFMSKVSKDGIIQKHKIFNSSNSVITSDLAQINGIDLLVTGSVDDSVTGNKKMIICRLDTSLNPVQSYAIKCLGSDIGFKIYSDSSGIVLVGSNAISGDLIFLKFDIFLNYDYSKIIDLFFGYIPSDISRMHNGNYLITGNGPNMLVLDSQLNLINHLNYGATSTNRELAAVLEATNNSLYLIGRNDASADKLLVKVDSNYLSGCYSTQTIQFNQYTNPVLIETLNLQYNDTTTTSFQFDSVLTYSWVENILCFSTKLVDDIQETLEITVWPIPAHNELNFQLISTKNLELESYCISDLSGRTLINSPVQENPNSISIDFLEPGVYLLQLKGLQTSISSKLFIKM